MIMKQKGLRNIVIIVIVVLVVVVLVYFILSRQMNIGQNNVTKVENSQTSLKGKNVGELMNLNVPIECDTIGLLEKAKTDRKSGEGLQVTTKLFIKGSAIREEGVSIFTNGIEKNTVNIINPQNKTLFTLLLDGSNQMASLNYNMVGGDQMIARYNNIRLEDMSCKASTFNESILTPQNICYMPPSKSTPTCR
jgi:hypothetical protein